MRNEGKDRARVRGIEIYQDMAGEKGIESDGKMGRQGKRGSIELNWDCLSNFEEKRDPSFFCAAQLGWHPANVICFESVCVLLYAWPGLLFPPLPAKVVPRILS